MKETNIVKPHVFGWSAYALKQCLNYFVLLCVAFCVESTFSADTYEWRATPNCHCGLGDTVIKNESVGVLFSRTAHAGAPIGFEIDFSGLNRISFQVNKVFFDHSNNTLRIDKDRFKLDEAQQFIRLANSYNTNVDLLISSDGGKSQRSTQKVSSGDIVILANDITHILKANRFDGLTIDLERLFNHDSVAYRLLIQELMKNIEAPALRHIKYLSVIISYKDLPKLRDEIGDKYDLPKHQNARLLLRLLDTGLSNIGVQSSVLVRGAKVRKLDSKSYLAAECGIQEGPIIPGSLQYSEHPKSSPLVFPEDRLSPLVSLRGMQDKFKNIKNQDDFCRIGFFNEFIINKYSGLAFEDLSNSNLREEAEIKPLGKWYPQESSESNTTLNASIDLEIVGNKGGLEGSKRENAYGNWNNLGLFAPIEDKKKMHVMKRFQQTYFPNLCQILCPYQRLALAVCLLLLTVFLGFVIASSLFYKLNLLFKRLPLVGYLVLFIVLASLIQVLTLCEPRYEFIKNGTLIVIVSVLVISRLIEAYNHSIKGRFP